MYKSTFIHKFWEMCSKLSKLNKKLRFILLSKKKKMILFTVRAGCLRRSVSQWREKINLPVIRICWGGRSGEGGDWLNLIGHRYWDPDHPGDELLNWLLTHEWVAMTDQSGPFSVYFDQWGVRPWLSRELKKWESEAAISPDHPSSGQTLKSSPIPSSTFHHPAFTHHPSQNFLNKARNVEWINDDQEIFSGIKEDVYVMMRCGVYN